MKVLWKTCKHLRRPILELVFYNSSFSNSHAVCLACICNIMQFIWCLVYGALQSSLVFCTCLLFNCQAFLLLLFLNYIKHFEWQNSLSSRTFNVPFCSLNVSHFAEYLHDVYNSVLFYCFFWLTCRLLVCLEKADGNFVFIVIGNSNAAFFLVEIKKTNSHNLSAM